MGGYMVLLGFIVLAVVFLAVRPQVTTESQLARFEEEHRQLLAQLSPTHRFPFKLYYINMDKSTERRAQMLHNLEQLNVQGDIRVERVVGHLGRTPSPYLDLTKSTLTDSEVGCTVSHVTAIMRAYQQGHELALVVEDDTCFGLTAAQVDWEYILAHVEARDPSWCVLSLYSRDANWTKPLDVKVWGQGYCTTGYLIHRRGMARVAQTLARGGEITEVKWGYLMADFILPKVLSPHAYVTTRPLLYSYWDTSTIHNDHDVQNKLQNARVVHQAQKLMY